MKRAAASTLLAAALVACTKHRAMAARDTSLVFHGVGTEPCWALEINASGLRFRTPEDTAGARYPISPPARSGDTLQWHATLGGRSLDARLWPAACSDGMSDRIWTHRALVRVDSVTYRGCAAQT